jgi:SAM-dependent methyltransferase
MTSPSDGLHTSHWDTASVDIVSDITSIPEPDASFDAILCSEVLEHVPDPKKFMSEVYRVGKGRGYLEFPLPPYDYLFDFDVHAQLVWFDEQKKLIKFLKKVNTDLAKFTPITSQLRRALELGWDDLVANNLDYFFIGFEFDHPIEVVEQQDLSQYYGVWQRDGNTLARKLGRKLIHILQRPN